MTQNKPLSWREWLQDMRRFNGRDADRATQILDLFDEMETIGESYLSVFAALERQGHQDTDGVDFDIVVRVENLAAQDLAIRTLCGRAGLIAEDDTTTPLAPLLAMFLPVD